MKSKIEAFEAKYRKVAKTVDRTDVVFIGRLEPEEFTAHAEVNRFLTHAFRHAVQGELQNFEACVQEAKNEFLRIKEASLEKMRSRA